VRSANFPFTIYPMKGKENKRNINKKKPQKKSKSKSQIKKTKQTDSKRKVCNQQGNTDSKFKKGISGNPKGRPKGSKNKFSIAELQQAMKNCEKRERMSFMEAWIESAWGNPGDMATIANFMLPKLKSIEQIMVSGESTEDKRKNLAIQKILQERCKTESDKKSNGSDIV